MNSVFIEDISSEFKTGKWTSVIDGMTPYRVFEDAVVYTVHEGDMVEADGKTSEYVLKLMEDYDGR